MHLLYAIKWQMILSKRCGDQIIWQSVFEISVATVYKGPLILLSPLWQMPPWQRMTYATVFLSGIISLCIKLLLLFSGGTRIIFYVRGHGGGKMHLENAKIPKFAKNGWFWQFFLLPGVQGWQSLQLGNIPLPLLVPPWLLYWQMNTSQPMYLGFLQIHVMDCLLWPSSL